MSGHVVAAAMIRETTRRHVSEPRPVAARRRKAVAVVLQRAAHRLDPAIAASARVQVQN
jgi:hypothetical protein